MMHPSWCQLVLTMSLKVENKLKFVGECPVHCLSPAGASGLYLCPSRSNHRRLFAAPTALSSPRLPFILLSYLHHLSLLLVAYGDSASLQPLLPVWWSQLWAQPQVSLNVPALQREMSHVSAEAMLQHTLRTTALPSPSLPVFYFSPVLLCPIATGYNY